MSIDDDLKRIELQERELQFASFDMETAWALGSMLRTMAAAYEVGQLRGRALHPAELWWLATQGSARSLLADDRIGNIAPGMEADLVVIDLASTPAIAQAAARAETLWEALVPTIMLGDDRAVHKVWISGKPAR